MIDKGPVLLHIADGIARLRLNRPDAANGMSAELLSALCDAIMVCHGAPDLRVLLLSGEGANFCAGGDIRAFASKGEKLPDYIRQATAYLQNAVTCCTLSSTARGWITNIWISAMNRFGKIITCGVPSIMISRAFSSP